VLGDSASKTGLKAQMFAWEDKGIAYLKGEGADAEIVRSVCGLDAPASERVATRARTARELQERPTGTPLVRRWSREVEQVVLLDDVTKVFGAAPVMHLADIVTGLAGLRSAAWGSLDVNALGKHLRNMEVRVDTVYVSGKPAGKREAKGVKREWLNGSTTRLVSGDEPGGKRHFPYRASVSSYRPVRTLG
jgi:S-DNA-T family DNA segregation ATPase FtsK/SpoIIIE